MTPQDKVILISFCVCAILHIVMTWNKYVNIIFRLKCYLLQVRRNREEGGGGGGAQDPTCDYPLVFK